MSGTAGYQAVFLIIQAKQHALEVARMQAEQHWREVTGMQPLGLNSSESLPEICLVTTRPFILWCEATKIKAWRIRSTG
jgi:hypothetical protein